MGSRLNTSHCGSLSESGGSREKAVILYAGPGWGGGLQSGPLANEAAGAGKASRE